MSSITTPFSKSDIMDKLVPKRVIKDTKMILEKHKEKVSHTTVPYYSTKYGYKKPLILYMKPDMTEEEVKAKFNSKFNVSEMNEYDKMRYHKV